MFLDPDESAKLIRGELASQMKTQGSLASELGISPQLLNMFLRRKLDLRQAQIYQALKILGFNQSEILPRLSVNANTSVDLNLEIKKSKRNGHKRLER